MKTHKSDTDQVSIDDVVALLEDGPQTTTKLAEWLGYLPQATVLAACNRLVRAGTLQRLPHPDRRWALASYVVPASVLERIARVQPKVAAPATRQPHERPPSETVGKDAAPSWWCALPANGFTAAAAAQLPRMAQSKFSRPTATGISTERPIGD